MLTEAYLATSFDALKAKMSSAAKRAQPTPLEPAEQAVFERRAAELESEYEAALAVAAARNRSSRPSSPAPSSSFSANSDGDEIVEGGPAVTEVTHKVDTLVRFLPWPFASTRLALISYACRLSMLRPKVPHSPKDMAHLSTAVASYFADWPSSTLDDVLCSSPSPTRPLDHASPIVSFLHPPVCGWLYAVAPTVRRKPSAVAYVEI